MKSSSLVNILALGLGLVSAGCLGAPDDIDQNLEVPGLSAQDGPDGSSGTNGADPDAFHSNVLTLIDAMGLAAADASGTEVNPTIEGMGLLDTAGGREVFSYAVRCALPTTTSLHSNATGESYAGGGLLNTTSGWMSAGLSTAQQEDVLACMIAHLNPFDLHVPIFLSGPSVTISGNANDLGFLLGEAVWQVEINAQGAPTYTIWPLSDLQNVCGSVTDESMITLVCGTPTNDCGVVIRHDFDTACTGTNGSFSCDGKPALQTSLHDSDVSGRHDCSL